MVAAQEKPSRGLSKMDSYLYAGILIVGGLVIIFLFIRILEAINTHRKKHDNKKRD